MRPAANRARIVRGSQDRLGVLSVRRLLNSTAVGLTTVPSMTKGAPSPNLAEMPKFSGTPPTRKPGDRPTASSTHASIDVVVVLPCVPATASTWRPCSTCAASHCGPLV